MDAATAYSEAREGARQSDMAVLKQQNIIPQELDRLQKVRWEVEEQVAVLISRISPVLAVGDTMPGLDKSPSEVSQDSVIVGSIRDEIEALMTLRRQVSDVISRVQL